MLFECCFLTEAPMRQKGQVKNSKKTLFYSAGSNLLYFLASFRHQYQNCSHLFEAHMALTNQSNAQNPPRIAQS